MDVISKFLAPQFCGLNNMVEYLISLNTIDIILVDFYNKGVDLS